MRGILLCPIDNINCIIIPHRLISPSPWRGRLVSLPSILAARVRFPAESRILISFLGLGVSPLTVFCPVFSCSGLDIINLISRKLEVSYCPYVSPSLVPISSKIYAVPRITNHLPQIHFNIILPSASRPRQRSLSLDLPTKPL